MRIIITLLLLTIATAAQDAGKYSCSNADKQMTDAYFENKKGIEVLADSLRQTRRGKLPFCWHGCAVNLPKPFFPPTAKNAGISGSVAIYAVADERGRVFYARPISGPKALRSSARQAACVASFTPISYNGQPMKFPWTIRYNFHN
jgi:hypothetical protein